MPIPTHIFNVLCNTSVGSLGNKPDEMDVNGITVFNCTLINTANGLRIKTKRGSASLKASRIFFDNIIMDKVKNPIIIDQNYGAKKNEVLSSANNNVSN